MALIQKKRKLLLYLFCKKIKKYRNEIGKIEIPVPKKVRLITSYRRKWRLLQRCISGDIVIYVIIPTVWDYTLFDPLHAAQRWSRRVERVKQTRAVRIFLDSLLCLFFSFLCIPFVNKSRKQQQQKYELDKRERRKKQTKHNGQIECGAKVCVSLKGKTPSILFS